jgi:ribosomal protein S16
MYIFDEFMKIKENKLGKEVKRLEFKLIKVSKNRKTPSYHIVISRKRSGSNSRLDKVGFFHFAKKYHQGFYEKKKTKLLGLNFEKIKKYILKGAVFHKNVIKILC